MRYRVELEESTAQVELEAGSASAPRLYVNGVPAHPGPRRGEFLLPAEEGREVSVRLKSQFLDPVPTLECDGRQVRVVPPFTWEWLFVALPVVLVVSGRGGAIGGVLGALAAWINGFLLRSALPLGTRLGLSVLVSFAALAISLILAPLLGAR